MFTKGDNVIFVNDPSVFPLLFTQQAADFSSNPDAATQDGTTGNFMQIGGYGRAYLERLVDSIRGTRPKPAKNHIITIDPADATQFDLAANFTPGTTIRFSIKMDLLYGSQIEFYRASPGEEGQFGRWNVFPIKLRAGDTEAGVLTRLASLINDIPTQNYGKYPYKADFGVTNAGKFTLQGVDPDYLLKMDAFEKVEIPSTQIAAFKPVIAQQAYEGEGNYSNLHATYRLETDASTEPYSLQQFDRVQKGRTYTCLQFYTATARPDLGAPALADSPVNASKNTFTLYVANGNEAFLQKVVAFLNRAGGTVTKTYVKSDGTELAVPGAAGTPGTWLADV